MVGDRDSFRFPFLVSYDALSIWCFNDIGPWAPI